MEKQYVKIFVMMFALVLELAVEVRPLYAQTGGEPVHSPSGQERAGIPLDPIVVIAAPDSTPLETTLNPKQAQLPVPAGDAADYLKTVPGFSAVRSGGANGDPVFRGMFGSRLNMLTNGANISGSCPNRMDAPSSYISPESFDRVTIIKGPQTVLWGGGASAATIRFERMPEKFTEPGARFRAGFSAGSYDRFDEYVEAAAGYEHVYARVNANYARSSDYEDGNGRRVPSKWMKWNTDAAIGWTPDDKTLLELSGGTGDGYARYAGRGMDGTRFLRESFAFRFEKSGLGTVLDKLEAQAYYNHTDHVMDNYTLRAPSGMMPMPMKSNPTRTLYGGRVAAALRLGEGRTLTTGFDVQFDEHTAWSTGAPERRADMEIFKFGVFGEQSTEIGKNDKIIAGLRGDYVRADDLRKKTEAGGMGGMSMTTRFHYDDDRESLLPSAFIRHEHTFDVLPLMSYIGIGYTERFPDYWELTQKKSAEERAFRDLRPEKTLQLDAGLQYKKDDLHVWLSAYAGLIKDYIVFNDQVIRMGMSTSTTTTVRNVDAHIMGGELGGSFLLFDLLRLSSSLAYAWAENTDDNRPLPQIPPLEARFGANVETDEWQAGVLWRVAARQDRVALNQGNVVGKDFGKSSGFSVLSAYAGVNFADHFNLSVGVENIFDTAYSEHLNLAGSSGWGFPADSRTYEPGRTFWAKVSVEF
ncbi:MAG: TonB-dependent copper receptor [Desulfovibrio sp.]|jgi:iron complex outermembrane receptor protein|nr:TonB-dependent copper receptor [Desulfovibrio sp.]